MYKLKEPPIGSFCKIEILREHFEITTFPLLFGSIYLGEVEMLYFQN